jgi:hypothetical protein
MTFQKGHQINKGRKFPNRTSPMKGKFHSDESKKKNSESHRGRVAWNKGIPMSRETKLKQSKIHKTKTGDQSSNWKGE